METLSNGIGREKVREALALDGDAQEALNDLDAHREIALFDDLGHDPLAYEADARIKRFDTRARRPNARIVIRVDVVKVEEIQRRRGRQQLGIDEHQLLRDRVDVDREDVDRVELPERHLAGKRGRQRLPWTEGQLAEEALELEVLGHREGRDLSFVGAEHVGGRDELAHLGVEFERVLASRKVLLYPGAKNVENSRSCHEQFGLRQAADVRQVEARHQQL